MACRLNLKYKYIIKLLFYIQFSISLYSTYTNNLLYIKHSLNDFLFPAMHKQ